MSTSQRAVMLCGWKVKAGMACLQVKLCVDTSERFRKYMWRLKALYKCRGLVLLLLYLTSATFGGEQFYRRLFVCLSVYQLAA